MFACMWLTYLMYKFAKFYFIHKTCIEPILVLDELSLTFLSLLYFVSQINL